VKQHLRWILLVLISAAFVINFIDRQTLSTVAPLLRDELHFSNSDYSYIVSSFLLGMCLFQLPVGWLMDRKGTKFGFALIFAWWSIVSGVHAAARTRGQFCALRFLLGAGECGNYSGGMKLIAQHFPVEERALAGGIFNSCTFLGSVVAPPLVVWLTLRYNWHVAFVAASGAGLVWLLPWLLLAPAPLARVEQRSTPIARGDLKALLCSRATWAVIAIRSLGGPVSHFYWFWLPEYLKRARHIDLAVIGQVVWIPFFCGGVGNLLGGFVSGILMRRGHSVTFSRRAPFIFGAGMAAACNLLVLAVPSLPLAVAVLSTAMLGYNMIEASYIGFITDIFPERTVGRVTGLTGIGDNLMSITLMLTTGMVLDRFSYVPVFAGAATMPILQIICAVWVLGPVRKLALPGAAPQSFSRLTATDTSC
jgi:ACS family hexuronate transporter-like MFS transporter